MTNLHFLEPLPSKNGIKIESKDEKKKKIQNELLLHVIGII
jgi:hypothetical protein